MSNVEELKNRGNDALTKGDYDEAIKWYSDAIILNNSNHVLFSNRSAAHLKAGNFPDALSDAEQTILLKPDWPKGYSRKGSVLAYMKKYDEAIEAYKKGLEIDPNNSSLKEGIEEVRKQMNNSKTEGGSSNGFGLNNLFGSDMFNLPEMLKKLQNDPRTKNYFKDPSYLQLLSELKQNPSSIFSKMSDPRIVDTFSVMFGINKDSDRMEDDTEMPESTKPTKPQPKPSEQNNEKMDIDVPENSKLALSEKELGNNAYKSKDFEKAIKHYEKAIEYDEADITFYNNLAAVYFELKDYKKCIEWCEKAVEIGRLNRADYKLIAKSFTRIGNAYKKMSDYKNAKIFYEKSLSEHRTPEIKTLLSEVEKVIKEEELKSYINPEKAEEEKEIGNELFKKGDYATAVKHYTEAIKRNPTEVKYYSNRAACYTKLAAFDLGLKDCEKCVELDPKFIKGWIRKGSILQAMHKSAQAIVAFQKALDIDPNNSEALNGYRQCSIDGINDPEQVKERAMADPEIQTILRDPAMRIILEQMQNDPKALHEHLKNPEIAAKIQKLIECGIISIH